jgi:hypothetical protein
MINQEKIVKYLWENKRCYYFIIHAESPRLAHWAKQSFFWSNQIRSTVAVQPCKRQAWAIKVHEQVVIWEMKNIPTNMYSPNWRASMYNHR